MSEPDLLKLVTAGSVDDGKSTLVGRLLYDTKSVLSDQLEAVLRTSAERGLADPDLSLLVDGLRAEREQGITIDVAYRYFATPRRTFVMADTPGHVQYTRNTVTGASTADHAILLADAGKGVLPQTRRHLAVNKLDLVDFAEDAFVRVRDEFLAHAAELGYPVDQIVAVPVSALTGDNVVTPSERTPWYDGPTLLDRLETVAAAVLPPLGLRLPVQYVLRPGQGGRRSYAGQLAAGEVRPSDLVVVLPGGSVTTVERIDTADGPVEHARAGDAVSLVLADDIDVGRGDLIAAAGARPQLANELDATVCWLSEKPLQAGARMLLKHGTRITPARVVELCSLFDEQNPAVRHRAERLDLNDIGCAHVTVADRLPIDDYADCRLTGSFVLIDAQDGDTLGAGLLGDTLATRGAA